MSKKQKTTSTHAGELSEQQLDKVAGGQEIRRETIVVTAQRPKPEQIVKKETIVVTAQREKPDLAGTKLAAVDAKSKKN